MAHIREIMAVGVASPLARMLGANRLDTVIAGGSSQDDATPLTINFALIECAAIGQGVRLGPATGAALTALFNLGPAAANVYPAEDETLNNQGPNLPLSLAAGQTLLGVPSVDHWLVQIPPGGPSGGIPDAPADGIAYGRLNAAWTPALALAGGAMTGPLTLAGDPTTALMAATRRYVDATAALLAPLASPAFSGAPSAPTPAPNDNSATLATTAYVQAQGYLASLTLAGDLAGNGASPLTATVVGLRGRAVAAAAPLDGQVLGWSAANGNWAPLPAPPASAGGAAGQLQWNNAGALAGLTISGDATLNTTTGALALAAVNSNIGTFQGLTLDGKGRVTAAANMNYAPIASPAFTGAPTAPTPATADNSTALATTGFVKAQSYATSAAVAAAYAPLASPALTGTPTAPTAAAATNTTQLATTAFVKAQGYGAGTVTSITAGAGLSGGTIIGAGTIALSTPVSVANGGTGLAGGTSGGIPYYSAAGTIASSAQLAANAFVIGGGAAATPYSSAILTLAPGNGNLTYTGNNMTVPGTATASFTGADGFAFSILASANANGLTNAAANFAARMSNGTATAPTAVPANMALGALLFQGYDGSAVATGAYAQAVVSSLWTGSNHGTYLRLITTPDGSTGTLEAMRLQRGAAMPNNVVGGDMGIGTINVSAGYYVGGASSLTSSNLTLNPTGSASPALAVNGIQVVANAGGQAGVQLNSFAGTNTISTQYAGGTPSAPTAVANAQRMAQLIAQGYNGSAYSGNVGIIDFVSTQAWTATANGTGIEFRTTLNGATGNNATMALATGGAGGLLLPGNVAGGDMGTGSVNVSAGYYLAGAAAVVATGWLVGAPTGGSKGAGTLNATAVYANGTLLTSDARMKRDIAPLAIDALALVRAIEPKSYKHTPPPPPAAAFDEDGEPLPLPPLPEAAWWERTWWGFLADEVDAAIAGAGHEWGGIAVGADGTQALSYNDLIAVLWRAVQELHGQVEALRGAGA